MPKIEMKIPHSLSQDEAMDRIRQVLGNVQQRFAGQVSEVQQDWTNNEGTFSFSVMNMPVSGRLTVNNNDVALDGKLPLAASLFQGKIKSIIMEEASKVLAKK